MKDNLCQLIKIKDIDAAKRKRCCSFDIDFINSSEFYILPGFIDVHVHLREPGFSYKETIATGTMAAAAGGFTDVFSMPNLNPTSDSMNNLQPQLHAIASDAVVNVYPYGTITLGEQGHKLSDMEELAEYVVGFTDDGRGVESTELMEAAMLKAKALNKPVVAHCEDENYPRESCESEWKQLERDLELVAKTGCKYHACHISTRESVQLIRDGKKQGLDITCETAPHYLTLSREDIEDNGRFKMNPPIKEREHREALIEAVVDGTIDMIATDHAPHSAEEKNCCFTESAFGIVGLETAYPVLYTKLVRENIITNHKLISLLYKNPRERFDMRVADIRNMLDLDSPTFTIWDMDTEYTIDSGKFLSKGRSTPFDGWSVYGKCMMTVVDGKIVWRA